MKQKLFLLIALFFALWQGAQAQTPKFISRFDAAGREVFILSNDGKYVYGAGVPAIKIDAETGKTLLLYDSLKCTNSAIAISNDGTMVAGGGQEQTVHICDAETGKQIKTLTTSLKYPGMIIYALAFSNNDKFLLSCASYIDMNAEKPLTTARAVFIWDISKDTLINVIIDGAENVFVSPNGKYFVTGSYRNQQYVFYDINNNDYYNISLKDLIMTHSITMDVRGAISSPNGTYFAYNDGNRKLMLRNTVTHEVREIDGNWGCCFYSDDYIIYGMKGKYAIAMQNLNTGNFIFKDFPACGILKYSYKSQRLLDCWTVYDFSGISSVDDNNDTGYEVLYPNPANNTVNLDFNLEQTSNVKITLTDLKGNTVKVIKNEVFEQGKHTISTSVSELSSGTYFINITTQSSSKYYKLIINN